MSRTRIGAALLAVSAVAAVARRHQRARIRGRRQAGRRQNGDADQAPRRDLPGERLVRPLLRHLSAGCQHGRLPVRRGSRHAAGQRALDRAARDQPEQRAAEAARQQPDGSRRRSRRADHVRPGSQLQRRAAGLRRRQMDQFVQSVGTDGGTHNPGGGTTSGGALCDPKIVMDYYDGNTVPALWNYAQHFSMSDNSFGTTFGPSAPGAINVTSGNTGGVDTAHEANNPSVASSTAPDADITPDGSNGFSLTSDAQPYWDDCSTRDAVALKGTNIGDELNAAGLSWGWFQGGFAPTTTFSVAAAAVSPGQSTAKFTPDEFSGTFAGKVVPTGASNQALCDAVHPVGVALGETAAVAHLRLQGRLHRPPRAVPVLRDDGQPAPPRSGEPRRHRHRHAAHGRRRAAVRHGEPQLRHERLRQSRRSDHGRHAAASALPAVTYLKAPGYQDGHAAYSDPADEQQFIVREINALEKTPDWSSTAVIISYDDSDGWYDHVYSGVVNGSLSPADNLTNTVKGPINAANPTSQQCGAKPQTATPLGRRAGPLRLRSAAAAAARLTLRGAERRRQQPERPVLDPQLHRVQLAPAVDPRLVRPGAEERRPGGAHSVRSGRALRLQSATRPPSPWIRRVASSTCATRASPGRTSGRRTSRARS